MGGKSPIIIQNPICLAASRKGVQKGTTLLFSDPFRVVGS